MNYIETLNISTLFGFIWLELQTFTNVRNVVCVSATSVSANTVLDILEHTAVCIKTTVMVLLGTGNYINSHGQDMESAATVINLFVRPNNEISDESFAETIVFQSVYRSGEEKPFSDLLQALPPVLHMNQTLFVCCVRPWWTSSGNHTLYIQPLNHFSSRCSSGLCCFRFRGQDQGSGTGSTKLWQTTSAECHMNMERSGVSLGPGRPTGTVR